MSKDNLDILFEEPYRQTIEDFEQLMEQSNKVFIIGAGCGKCAGLPLTSELTSEVFLKLDAESNSAKIFTAIKKHFEQSDGSQTIEDYMSELVDHIAIAQRHFDKGIKNQKIKFGDDEFTINQLNDTLSDIKQKIYDCIQNKKIDITTHRNFVRAIHKTLRFGKGKLNNKTDYIILNYDTLFEDALAIENINYADGFWGGATGWWDIETYKKLNIETKILKPHGSLDWCLLDEDKLPRRIRNNSAIEGIKQKEKILIWPASTKYRETQLDPYAQILDLMRKSFRPNSNEQTILCVVGYRFADSHINIEIENALMESEGNLTLVAFIGDDKINDKILSWINDSGYKKQIRIYYKFGFYHGDSKIESKIELPWWKFENLTRLLEGEKA
ncbi:MAG: SIR2 family protein [Ignavibacteriaceae bacterium]